MSQFETTILVILSSVLHWSCWVPWSVSLNMETQFGNFNSTWEVHGLLVFFGNVVSQQSRGINHTGWWGRWEHKETNISTHFPRVCACCSFGFYSTDLVIVHFEDQRWQDLQIILNLNWGTESFFPETNLITWEPLWMDTADFIGRKIDATDSTTT
jgi:hypothetical protein